MSERPTLAGSLVPRLSREPVNEATYASGTPLRKCVYACLLVAIYRIKNFTELLVCFEIWLE